MKSENIAALSSGDVKSGVAVIRISGDSPLSIAEQMFTPSGSTPVKDFEPYKMYTGEIDCGGFSDFGLCVYFKAPKSFTGEDVVEFHSHGGSAITRGILRKIFSLGARQATNGEFTKRAFINGKLSLSSCEGLIDMINGESASQAKAGYYLYREKLLKETTALQARLEDALCAIEADMDFPEEDLDIESRKTADSAITEVIERLDKLLLSYRTGRVLVSGVKVSIVGKPNTGKSSLLNALLNYDKAIVSSVAGTTRDIVEGAIDIGGVRFYFSDTAGIREDADTIESLGVELSKKSFKASDLVLFVVDGTAVEKEDVDVKKLLGEKDVITVINKSDKDGFDLEKAKTISVGDTVIISAKNRDNLEELRNKIYQKTVGAGIDLGGDFITEERHFDALSSAKGALLLAKDKVETFPLDLLSIDIKVAWEKLGEISGKTASEEIIDGIFSRFCVGK